VRGARQVNARDGQLHTPLHLAAAAGSAELARLLLRAGADVRARGQEGDEPLHVAASQGAVAVMEVPAPAPSTSEAGPPLRACRHRQGPPRDRAAARGERRCGEGGGPRCGPPRGDLCAHEQVMLEHGAQLDAPNNDRLTARHLVNLAAEKIAWVPGSEAGPAPQPCQ